MESKKEFKVKQIKQQEKSNEIKQNKNQNEINFKEIEKKWQEEWKKAKIFYAEPNPDLPKYFLTTPYPYVNGLMHLGHSVTSLHPDVIARYKRMKGYNVLWSFAFHATGSPIVSYADGVKKRDERILNVLAKSVPEIRNSDGSWNDALLKKFEEPEFWVRYFIEEAKKDIYAYGYSLDPRRHFFTTSLNPPYDAFVRWQFNKLKEKGYVVQGKYPVVYCPNCKVPVGDHARLEGEGETVQEYTLLKFPFKYKDKDVFLVAATLRPETVFGQTNFWINPNIHYVLIKVKYKQNNKHFDEYWIISKRAAEMLEYQDKDVEIIEDVDANELIGKYCIAPMIHREIPILPAEFVTDAMGTGLVTSVPSDAPHDYIGLRDLKTNEELRKKYHVPYEVVKDIKPIPIIVSKEYGDLPAVKIVEELNIKDQHDPKLEEAKKKVYALGYYTGILNENCGEFAGMKVEEAKELMKQKMIENDEATVFYELTGKVICRCGTECIPAVVDNQWFIDYSNLEWKKLAKECVAQMRFVPEIVRQQFYYTVDWLKQWPCTRTHGLGTRLPWDEQWLIESLSDSTIYMAYYTIAKYLQHPSDYGWNIDFSKTRLEDDFFDYVFLGIGNADEIEKKYNMPKGLAKQMHEEFEYWYPHDYRNSAKDLVQNHLTFSIFHHTAIFPKDKWPRLYDINGFVQLQGQKMSKSKGNFLTTRDLIREFGADVTRVTALYAGEGLDDPTFEFEFFRVVKDKLSYIYRLYDEIINVNGSEYDWPEELFESRINELIEEIDNALDNFKYRTYVQKLLFEYLRAYDQYKKLCKILEREMNKELSELFYWALIKMLQPGAPHIAEELWHKEHDTFVSLESWPKVNKEKINPDAKIIYELSNNLIDDIKTIQKLAKLEKINSIKIIVAKNYKYEMFRKLKDLLQQKKDFKEIIKEMAKEFGRYEKDIPKKIQKLIKNQPIMLDKEKEMKIAEKVADVIKKIFNANVEIYDGDKFEHKKSSQAIPLKPAIILE